MAICGAERWLHISSEYWCNCNTDKCNNPNLLNCREIPFLKLLVAIPAETIAILCRLGRSAWCPFNTTIVLCVISTVMTLHAVEKEVAGTVKLRWFIVMEKHSEELSCTCTSEGGDVNLTINKVSEDEPVEGTVPFPHRHSASEEIHKLNTMWKHAQVGPKGSRGDIFVSLPQLTYYKVYLLGSGWFGSWCEDKLDLLYWYYEVVLSCYV